RETAAAAARAIRGSEPSDEDVLADIEYLRRACGSPRTLEAYLETVSENDVRHVLPGIQVPTLLVHGSEAVVFPIEGARYAAERIPGARLLELPGTPLVPWGADLDRALDETEAFLTEAWESGAWEEPEPDRVLSTVLFTD